MIQWKQRLYAFLLRRVLGPFLDVSATKKLHDSIDVSLQEGKFVLNDVTLNADYLTEKLADGAPGLSIRRAKIARLEINLTLRENSLNFPNVDADEEIATPKSSLAWRAMKLGTMYETRPAVSLLAEIKIHGVDLELEPCDCKRRRTPPPETLAVEDANLERSSKSVIGSYVDTALASLQLSLKLTNINVKLCQKNREKETWVTVRLSSISYKDLDVALNGKSGYKTVVNKSIEFSEIKVQAGEQFVGEDEMSKSSRRQSTVALAQGTGYLYARIIEYSNESTPTHGKTEESRRLQQDIEIKLNHQLNLSVDNNSISFLRNIAEGFSNVSEHDVGEELSSRPNSPGLDGPRYLNADETDQEDLKAITGIMKQYREAYHLAQKNQIRGGILVPSNAYLDGQPEEVEDTFDVFFDANDQSFYNAASVLAESVRIHEDQSGEVSDFVHRKVRLQIQSGCLKISFKDPDRQFRPEEYALMTMEEMNVSASSSQVSSEIALSVAHFEIEDSQLDTTKSSSGFVSVGGSPMYDGTVEIGTLLGFVAESGGCDDYANEVLISQSPCISLNLKNTKETATTDSIKCDITLWPIEIHIRQRTMSNLSSFAAQLQDVKAEQVAGSPSPNTQMSVVSNDVGSRKVSFRCSCPSITISIPLIKQVPTGPMFNRSVEILDNVPVKGASLGFLLNNTSIDFYEQKNHDDPTNIESQGTFSCHNLLFFATAPIGDKVAVDTRMQRTDIFLASGRMEVIPYIPLSVEFKRNNMGTKEGNHGRNSFPIAPAISSFKARQEDEDEELKIDRLLFSKLQDVSADSRKELRGTDPQIAMIAEAEKCDSVVTIIIPEIFADLTKSELEVLLSMLEATKKPNSDIRNSSSSDSTDSMQPAVDGKRARASCIALTIDQVSFSLKEDQQGDAFSPVVDEGNRFSCLLAIDTFKTHALINDSGLKHLRVLAQEPCLYSAYLPMNEIFDQTFEKEVEKRVDLLRKNIRSYGDAFVSPLIYRSHLFTPISHDTPSLLMDFIDPSSGSPQRAKEFIQKRVHVTAYHLTYRYNLESEWMKDVSKLLPNRKKTSEETGDIVNDEESHSITRVFVSVADCNLDYTTPKYFKSVSRSIIRVGDFRFSSNIMKPAGLVQAYSSSLGDFSYHICNMGYSYENENSKLCRSSILFKKKDKYYSRKSASISGSLAEALLRDMSFVNVLSLDSMDAIVVVKSSNSNEGRRNKMSRDPRITTSLTFGMLSIHACKDSFGCFSTTLGELSAKLTALTDEDIEKLKTESNPLSVNNAKAKKQTNNSEAFLTPVDQDSADPSSNLVESEITNGHPELLPAIEVPSNEGPDSSRDFLLDGYEWTTIDHDPLPEIEIPDGNEEVAVWYDNSPKLPNQVGDDTNQNLGLLERIIPQHFPHHSITDPLSEGDMGAPNYAGQEIALVATKSRLLVHKLAVRLRFFDGYDWPDQLTLDQRRTASRAKNDFVIQPEPMAKNLSKDLPSQKVSKTSTLMAGLLDTTDGQSSTFNEPLPEERAANIERQEELRRLSRKSNLFFQLSANGLSLRIDSFEKSESHRLVSILSLSIHDLFLAETASRSNPVKMLGEWVNVNEHPRDTRFGTLMFKMVTWHPENRVTSEGEVANDICEVIMQLLPMRCIIDQHAVQFIRAFFHSEEEGETEEAEKWSSGLHVVPPPRVRAFRVKPWKLKVDYLPKKLDVGALRDGSFVELVNISPIDGMVITLSEVRVQDVVGFGLVFSGLVGNWVREIVATQLHKFLTNARPFEPFTDVGQGLSDLVVLPYDAFKNGEGIRRAISSGFKSLAEIVAFQALTTSSRLTQYAANKMAGSVGSRHTNMASNPLPSRPTTAPKGVTDVTGHAVQSLARGFQAANYKVVVVPYREYSRNGATGAATSVIRGIPVLLVAPLTGATEALSYTLLGARNALRPDIRKEEEASRTGFNANDA